MIVQGLKLTLLGMGVVFCFLGLLMLFIQISARVLASGSQQEEDRAAAGKPGVPEEKKRRKVS